MGYASTTKAEEEETELFDLKMEGEKEISLEMQYDNGYISEQEQQHQGLHNQKDLGQIGRFDFITWTVIPLIGILFCMIHVQQSHFWQWTGSTAEDAQSLTSKIVVSTISFIIGGTFIANLMKTITGLSFAYMKFRGAHFSQLVTIIGGYTPSFIPLLTAGQGWMTIIVILLVTGTSIVAKQLGVVSMGVVLVKQFETMQSFTPNYTTCIPTARSSTLGIQAPIMTMDIFNSLRNPNTSHTNELYDRGIPASLQGYSKFDRVLPYANVSCTPFSSSIIYGAIPPNVTTMDTLWTAFFVLPFHTTSSKYVNCTISIGHANAYTTCNNTMCQTQRISAITPYSVEEYGRAGVGSSVSYILSNILKMLNPMDSNAINQLVAWLLGGDLGQSYLFEDSVPGENLQVIQNRTELLATVIGRVLCDFNNYITQNSTTPIESYYLSDAHYVYELLWEFPFYLMVGLFCLLWMICMYNLWMTPESRLISIEWLVSQYLDRNSKTYMSGTQLVNSYENIGLYFQVKEKNISLNNDSTYTCIVVEKLEQFVADKSAERVRNKVPYA